MSEKVDFRASDALCDIIAAAQGDSPNRSAAAKALMIAGAERLGIALDGIRHEMLLLLMEELHPALRDTLRDAIGVAPAALPPRPRPAPRERRATPKPRAAVPRPQPGPHGADDAVVGPSPLGTSGAAWEAYDVGEEC